MINELFVWLKDNYLELFGTLAGFVYIYFEIKEKIWLWPLGIITSALYIIVFFSAKIYADMGLQVYYLVVSIYGWYWWLNGKKQGENKLAVTNIAQKDFFTLGGITIILFIGISQILIHLTDSEIPYIDSLTTSLSITATWMLARKIIEQWYIWIFVNALSIGVYVYKELYVTVILFAVYTVLAIVGLLEWQKSLKTYQKA